MTETTRAFFRPSRSPRWPKAIAPDYFLKHHAGKIPSGVLRTVVPAAPDAWITALTRFGTMSFGDVAASAIAFARDGFPVYPLMAEIIAEHEADYRQYPSSVPIYLPRGRPPRVGELFVQKDLAATMQYMVDEEAAARSRGREAALAAARDAFYVGDIADRIVAFQKQNGGFLSAEDLAGYRSGFADPVETSFLDIRLYGCGPWCQGPSLLAALNLLDAAELRALGHTVTILAPSTRARDLAAGRRALLDGLQADVVALGPAAQGVSIGKTYLVYPWIGCGQCAVCRRGDENLCSTPNCLGIHRNGGYADQLLAPDPKYLVDLDGLDPIAMAPFACSGLTAFSALKKVALRCRQSIIKICRCAAWETAWRNWSIWSGSVV